MKNSLTTTTEITLLDTFARLDQIKKEKLHGRTSEGRWTLQRFEIEIHNNGLGTWTACIRDWKRVGPEFKNSDSIGIGVSKDPNQAMLAAMYQLGIVPLHDHSE